jgi:hypothetical protein
VKRLTSLSGLLLSSLDHATQTQDRNGHLPKKSAKSLYPDPSDNATKKDWVILLEAGTIVGPTPERLRVARCMQERKIVKKYNILLRAEHFLVVEGYDPRIHAVYYCPSPP